jgi:hypothetical protein
MEQQAVLESLTLVRPMVAAEAVDVLSASQQAQAVQVVAVEVAMPQPLVMELQILAVAVVVQKEPLTQQVLVVALELLLFVTQEVR